MSTWLVWMPTRPLPPPLVQTLDICLHHNTSKLQASPGNGLDWSYACMECCGMLARGVSRQHVNIQFENE